MNNMASNVYLPISLHFRNSGEVNIRSHVVHRINVLEFFFFFFFSVFLEEGANLLRKFGKKSLELYQVTVDSRYLELAYLE